MTSLPSEADGERSPRSTADDDANPELPIDANADAEKGPLTDPTTESLPAPDESKVVATEGNPCAPSSNGVNIEDTTTSVDDNLEEGEDRIESPEMQAAGQDARQGDGDAVAAAEEGNENACEKGDGEGTVGRNNEEGEDIVTRNCGKQSEMKKMNGDNDVPSDLAASVDQDGNADAPARVAEAEGDTEEMQRPSVPVSPDGEDADNIDEDEDDARGKAQAEAPDTPEEALRRLSQVGQKALLDGDDDEDGGGCGDDDDDVGGTAEKNKVQDKDNDSPFSSRASSGSSDGGGVSARTRSLARSLFRRLPEEIGGGGAAGGIEETRRDGTPRVDDGDHKENAGDTSGDQVKNGREGVRVVSRGRYCT